MPIRVTYAIREIPFRHPFTISKATKTHQPIFFVRLEHFGLAGFGEAPAITYYHIPVGKMAEDLESKRRVLESFAFSDPERFWHFLHHLFPANSFLVAALDMAGWDLFGRMRRKPLHALWGMDLSRMPLTDYTIGIDHLDKMVEKMHERPWPVYKIKVGFEGDVETVAALRVHTTSPFRVDANGAWDAPEALKKIEALAALGVELIEQPLAPDDHDGMMYLKSKSPLPLYADESCVHESDVEKCAGLFHGINIKLTKCSGLTPARRMIRVARERGLGVMLGCMNETRLGSAALAHLAPSVDFLDMDGPLLLAEEVAEGLELADGRVMLSEQPGLGVTPLASLFAS